MFLVVLWAVATPKQIRELMQIEDLTNDQVKSHLQVDFGPLFLDPQSNYTFWEIL